jgi:hypothetical protein
MNALKEKLDVTERSKFRKLESIVAEGISSFVAVGEALKEIRDGKLYREAYKTFEKYVRDKWGFDKSRAYQLIDASEIKANLSTIVDKTQRASEISNEGQLREFRTVPVDLHGEVVERAAELAGDDKITASDLKQARQEVLGEVTATVTEHQTDVWEDVKDEPEPEVKPSKPLPKTVMSQSPQELVASIHAAGETLLALVKEVNRLSDQVGGEWIDCQEVETRAKALRKLIRGFAHWVDCPKCNGKKCDECKRRGWLSVERKQYLSQEMKDLLEVA